VRLHLDRIANYDDFRRMARKRLPRVVFEFIDGGCGAENALDEAVAAFARVKFEPRFMVDVSEREVATTVLGEHVALPIGLAPAGMPAIAHSDAELGAARAAHAAGAIFCLSSVASRSIEQVAEVTTGPLWMQLFPWRNERDMGRLIERARDAGYRALVVTIDSPVGANRERDLRNGARLPPALRLDHVLNGLRKPRWVLDYYRRAKPGFANIVELAGSDDAGACGAYIGIQLLNAAAGWEFFDFVRSRWDGPVVAKGVLSQHDALAAVGRGADAVWVSSHGGRQLDSTLSPLEALPAIVEAVGDRIEVFLDGGVRRGEDAVKARALGARAVFVGRPWVMSLAAAGEPGVARMLELLRMDVDRTLGLIGVPRFDDVGPEVLVAGARSGAPVA
jgi:L-lactate dehydrogenase (cytochrome)